MSQKLVRAHWDDQQGVEPGWYVQVFDEDPETGAGYVVTDSVKVTFPVEVENFDRSEADDLAAALAEHYTGTDGWRLVVDEKEY
jgi:hypothetical protein